MAAGETQETPEAAGILSVPGFQLGGRVDRTGIALVHEGEYVVPAPGSEAVVTPANLGSRESVAYSFPVEIEVVGQLSDDHKQALAEFIYDELATALESRTLPS